MTAVLAHLGRVGLEIISFIGGCFRLLGEFTYWLLIGPFRGYRLRVAETVRQAVRIGVNAVPIVFLVNFFVGVTLAVTVADILEIFGAPEFTGAVMGVGFWRELAPLLTGIVMSGFAGASLAAEMGTMKVNEELMALDAMALSPVRFLCVPRLLAILVMVPALALLGAAFGIFGGYLVYTALLGFSQKAFFDKMVDAMVMKDIWVGCMKAGIFGVIVGLVGLAQGFQVRGGAEGVGRATTNAVVYSIILIIATDCALTVALYF